MSTISANDTFLAVPVSAVPDRWLLDEFLPQAEAVLAQIRGEGGIVWLPVDASGEADYLLTKVLRHCERLGWESSEVEVSPFDPYQFWVIVLGSPDAAGIHRSTKLGSVQFVRSGELLPAASIRMHFHSLLAACRLSRFALLLPVFRTQAEVFSLNSSCPCLEVPSFADATPERRQALAEALTASRFPGLQAENQREFAARLLAAQPRSRPQLELWIEKFEARRTHSHRFETPLFRATSQPMNHPPSQAGMS